MEKYMLKKGMKMILACILGCSVLTACSENEEKLPIVSVGQIVEHTSLNTIRSSFLEEMEALGYKDGENITIDYKNAGGSQSTLNSIMTTFAGNKSDVIVAIATPTAMAAAKYSNEIPIIFSAVSDPIEAGLMDDLTKPNHNITGTSDEIQVDQVLELALTLDPDLKSLGFIYNSSEANSISNLKKAKAFCEKHNIELIEASGANITDIQSAVSVLVPKCDAIFAPNDNTVNVASTSKRTATRFLCVLAASGKSASTQYPIRKTKIVRFSFNERLNNSGYIFTKIYAISIPYAHIQRLET